MKNASAPDPTPTPTLQPPPGTVNKTRKKRAPAPAPAPLPAACDCTYDIAYSAFDTTKFPNMYVWYSGSSMTWPCGFSCCEMLRPANMSWSRLARVDSTALLDFLTAKNVLQPAWWPWVGLHGDTNGVFYWYDNLNATRGGPVSDPSTFCNCEPFNRNSWPNGGAVYVDNKLAPPYKFDTTTDSSKSTPLCECKYPGLRFFDLNSCQGPVFCF